MRTIVIYHGGCWDGFCAAWLLWRLFGDENVEYIPARYGEPAPMEKVHRNRVIIVDFSYPRDVLLEMHHVAEELVVLDHHKTAEKELSDLPFCVFDMDSSGAQLTADWIQKFYPLRAKVHVLGVSVLTGAIAVPWLVSYTADRDLWKWELPHSKEVNAALRSYPLDFKVWDSLLAKDWPELVPEGAAILRWQSQVVAAKVEQSHIVKVMDLQWRVANATTLVSETCEALAEGGYVGCCWFEAADGSRHYSLRSKTIDVGAIAKSFGGGGHAKAAGFKLFAGSSHPWQAWELINTDWAR